MSLNRDCTVLCYEILHLTTIAKNCVQMVAIYQKRERKKNVTPKVDSFLAQDSSWRGPIRYGPPTVSRNSLHSCRKNKFRPWFPITLLLLRINMELEIWIMFKSCKKSLECPHGSNLVHIVVEWPLMGHTRILAKTVSNRDLPKSELFCPQKNIL